MDRDTSYWDAIRSEVDKAPELSPAQRDQLHVLTGPMRTALAERKRPARAA